MKLHTTIRSLGFGCFGEQLHLQLTTRWFRIKKEMPRRLKRHDGACFEICWK